MTLKLCFSGLGRILVAFAELLAENKTDLLAPQYVSKRDSNDEWNTVHVELLQPHSDKNW